MLPVRGPSLDLHITSIMRTNPRAHRPPAPQVAWLLNLRGSDVSCNPVFLSYVMVGHGQLSVVRCGGQLGRWLTSAATSCWVPWGVEL